MALNFPDSPTDGQIYNGFQWDATPGVWRPVASDPSLAGLSDTDIVSPASGEKLVYDGTAWVNVEGYIYVQTVEFTSSGAFAKSSYPWLRAIRVKAVGGGGGGGGAGATGATTTCAGSGGQGGVYGERFITDIAGLSSSETVTVGAAGAGGSAGANDGSAGGSSSFGSLLVVNGGREGIGITAGSPPRIRTSHGGNTGATGADFSFKGRPGGAGFALDGYFQPGNGGYTFLAPESQQTLGGRTTRRDGPAGVGFGAGGSGGGAGYSQSASAGGNGDDGVVIVELFA